MVVSRGGGEPGFDVPAPFLSAEDMVAVREHLARLLQADVVEGDLPDLAHPPAAPPRAPPEGRRPARAAASQPAPPGPSRPDDSRAPALRSWLISATSPGCGARSSILWGNQPVETP
jgi:hypothetical protein